MANVGDSEEGPIRTIRILPLGEELFSAISHGIGALLGIAGLVLGLVRAAHTGRAVAIVSVAIYGATLVLLYLMSCLRHALAFTRAKVVFRVLDHASVFLFIAGTYTVYTLAILSGALGWTIFGIIWGLAVTGICLDAAWALRPKWLSPLIYVVMGWLVIFAIGPMRAALPSTSFGLLLAGGIVYTAGAFLHSVKSVSWTHPVWHLFVLAGSILHFFSVMRAIG